MATKLKVMSEQCNQCLFSKHRIVSGARMKEVIQECLSHDTHFQCHKGTIAHEDIACKGFVDTYGYDVLPVRVALMFNLIEYIDPDGDLS